MADVFDVEQLAHYVSGISDVALRAAFLRHRLVEIGPFASADFLAMVFEGPVAPDAPLGKLRLAIGLVLTDRAAADLCEEIRLAAIERGHFHLVEALRREEQREDENKKRLPDFGKGRPLTLGERKSLARTRNRDALARVMRDPHPDVMRIFLENPTVTEDDIVRLCSKRPIESEVLREVAANTKWAVRARVRRAVIMNPYTPLDVALHFVALLSAHERAEIRAAGGVSEAILEACRSSKPPSQ